jgi:hypothetical protein
MLYKFLGAEEVNESLDPENVSLFGAAAVVAQTGK